MSYIIPAVFAIDGQTERINYLGEDQYAAYAYRFPVLSPTAQPTPIPVVLVPDSVPSVQPPPTGVPEPATLYLCLAGIAIIIVLVLWRCK